MCVYWFFCCFCFCYNVQLKGSSYLPQTLTASPQRKQHHSLENPDLNISEKNSNGCEVCQDFKVTRHSIRSVQSLFSDTKYSKILHKHSVSSSVRLQLHEHSYAFSTSVKFSGDYSGLESCLQYYYICIVNIRLVEAIAGTKKILQTILKSWLLISSLQLEINNQKGSYLVFT